MSANASNGSTMRPVKRSPALKNPRCQANGGHVAERGAEREGNGDGQEVEEFPTGARDAVDRERRFDVVPPDEDRDQRDPEADGRHDVGDVERDVDDVGAHRAKDAHHDNGGPVGGGAIRWATVIGTRARRRRRRPSRAPPLRGESMTK